MLKKQESWKRVLAIFGIAFIVLRILPGVLALFFSFIGPDLRKLNIWKGLGNYIDVFTQTGEYVSRDSGTEITTEFNLFFRALKNTAVLGILSGGLTALTSGLLVWALLRLPKRARTAVLVLLAVPALIPGSLFSALVIDMCSSDGIFGSMGRLFGNGPFNLLSRKELFPAIVAFGETVRTAFYPTLVGVMVIKDRDDRKIVQMTLCYFAIRVFLLPETFTDGILHLYNPLIYATGETLGTLSYRKGYQEGKSYFAAALYVIRCLMTALAAVPVAKLAEKTCRRGSKNAPAVKPRKGIAIALSVVMSLPFLGFCLYMLNYSLGGLPTLWKTLEIRCIDPLEFAAVTGERWLNSLACSLLVSSLYALYGGAVALTVAYVLMGKRGKRLAAVLLCCLPGEFALVVLLKTLGIDPYKELSGIAEMLTFQCLAAGVPVLGAFGLAAYLKDREFAGFREYFKASAPALTVICLASFCLRYGADMECRYWPGHMDTMSVGRMIYRCFVADTTGGIVYDMDKDYLEALACNDIASKAWALMTSLPGVVLGLIQVVLRDRLPAHLMCIGLRR